MDIILKISEELGIKKWQTEAAVTLIDEGNTIPFISRYRKEATGTLNDEQLRNLHERLSYLRNLEERKETVLKSIEEQGKLTEELNRFGRNNGSSRRLIPPIQAKTKNPCYNRKRKRIRTFGKYHFFTNDKNIITGRSRTLH